MSRTPKEFHGDRKVGRSFLNVIDICVRNLLLPRVPQWCETYHLTLLTILWSCLVVIAGWLAGDNIQWLWLSSGAIVLQYVTDLLDGAVGRARNTGLVKWGYFMDHFLDYVFLCAIVIGYAFLFKEQYAYLHLALLAIYGAFMVNAFLAFGATNAFRISFLGIGPTEARLAFVTINTLLIVFGRTFLAPFIPWLIGVAMLCLVIVVYRTQRVIWNVDMQEKRSA
ncbi:MAG: hypothetical protein Q7T01_02150 [bacterium]|nr:hypothetical protein [bacterium]